MTPNFRILLNVVQMNFGAEAKDALNDLCISIRRETLEGEPLKSTIEAFDRFESAINNHK